MVFVVQNSVSNKSYGCVYGIHAKEIVKNFYFECFPAILYVSFICYHPVDKKWLITHLFPSFLEDPLNIHLVCYQRNLTDKVWQVKDQFNCSLNSLAFFNLKHMNLQLRDLRFIIYLINNIRSKYSQFKFLYDQTFMNMTSFLLPQNVIGLS